MHKRFRSFIPSFKESRLIFEDAPVTPEPVVPPAPEPKPEPKPDPMDTEGRITTLAREKKELEDKLAKRDADDKAAAEAKLLEEGKLKELLQSKEKELADLTGSSASMKTKLEAYEKLATEQVAASIKAIGDKDKQATVTEMLEGKPIEEQVAMLPRLLKLVGAESTSFGGATPTTTKTPDKASEDVKQKRFDELLLKATKERLTPQEQHEKDTLAKELSTYLKS